MKYLGVLIAGLMMFTLGCSDPAEEDEFDVEAQFSTDLDLIDNWITENAITDTLHHWTKIRYTINQQGDGIKAQPADAVKVKYEGRFLDGEVFDSNESYDFVLNTGSVILGWYYMVQEMREGDEFTIYLPSFYAYGPNGSGSIPPNTVIVFDITLIRVGI